MKTMMQKLFDKWVTKKFNGMTSKEVYDTLRIFYGDTKLLRSALGDMSPIIELAQDRAREGMDRLYDMFRLPILTKDMAFHLDRIKYCVENTYWQ